MDHSDLIYWCFPAIQITLHSTRRDTTATFLHWYIKKLKVLHSTCKHTSLFCMIYFNDTTILWGLTFYQNVVLYLSSCLLVRWKPLPQEKDQQRPLCLVCKSCWQAKTFQRIWDVFSVQQETRYQNSALFKKKDSCKVAHTRNQE